MKYIITGSLGHISLPVIKSLLTAGHNVTVVSSNIDKKEEIEKLGAKAAIGSVSDQAFVSNAFLDAEVAYLMLPNDYAAPDYPALQRKVSDIYVQAIRQSNITHVVLLSSIGAHLRHGAGPIDGLAYLEEKLLELTNVHTKFLRPSYFYSNLYALVGMIKHAGIAGSNFGDTDEKLVLADTNDIAEEAAKHLLNLFTGNSITYIASDERHPNEIAEILGKSVGKENIPWITFTDEQAVQGMLDTGLNAHWANLYEQLNSSIRTGKLQEDYWKNKPETLGKYKLEDFARDFAAAYEQ